MCGRFSYHRCSEYPNGAVPVFMMVDAITAMPVWSSWNWLFPKANKSTEAHALGNPFDLITVCEFCHKHDLDLIEDKMP